ncbi:DegV family protein [Oceanirhabdus sp. W0125-5]|uniref:DegV family protein n=1 Tax=Oceanirhabdus sp. W0125-5 TaxID=2999116 RepID=UPI0022F322C2|nr:DegV family protein [Oceanirhabdus sp. W0125-5]WBW98644.1 DegV family protein [Oceanirhabdus sp. W0125-5]
MEKIAIITDSACDLTNNIIDAFNINVLPFRIIYKDREYRDGVDIDPEYVYNSLKTEQPTTSLPSMQDMYTLYERLVYEGYTHAIAITLSSGLSGVFNALKLVSHEYKDKIQSCIYDSKSISLGEGAILQEVGKMVKDGVKFDDIVNELPNLRSKIKLFFVFETLEYLIRGGRIGKVSGTIGELLNIKPIVSVGDDGKYFTYAKVRGRKQSLKKIIDIGKEMIDKNCKICIMDGQAKAEAEKIYKSIKEYSDKLNKGCVELLGTISPVAGVHSGPGFVGIGAIEL